jgi:hypothetical protein
LKDIFTEIEYKGEKYNLAFNLNVMEEIQAEYGNLNKWGEKCQPKKGEPDAKAVKFGFTSMLNEGIDIYNSENPTETKPFLTPKQVGRIISALGGEATKAALYGAVTESTQSAEKNA